MLHPGMKVQEIRQSRGWSRAELSRRVSDAAGYRISETAIYHFEVGKVRNPRYVHWLAHSLGLEVKELEISSTAA